MLLAAFRRAGLLMAALISCALPLSLSEALAEKRLALVIGINDYQAVSKLEKAVGDAEAIAAKLSGLGFTVTTSLNADRRGLNLALASLYKSIEPGDTVLVHYSGHGVEINGQNYLLPADIPVPESGQDDLLRAESLALASLVETLGEKGAGVRILIIDACRDNPFAKAGKRSLGGTRGLGAVEPPKGTFIMYSAGTGQAALDRLSETDTSPTSVYTRVLLSRFDRPGLPLRDLAASVREEVDKLSKSVGHEQRPAYYDDLPADFSFAPSGKSSTGGEDTVVIEPTPPPPPPPPTQTMTRLEEARQAWEAIKDMKSPATFDVVAKQYADTIYGELARSRAEELRKDRVVITPPPQPKPPKPPKKVVVLEPEPDPEPEERVTKPSRSRWFVVIGSFPKAQRGRAKQRAAAARHAGFGAQIVDTDAYENLVDGLWAVVINASTKSQAESIRNRVRGAIGDAYVREAF